MTRQSPPGWEIVDNHHLHRKYTFPDFRTALDFVNRVGAVAEEQGHHPDIELGWGRVEIVTYTHTSNGLTDKDTTLAAAIDQLPLK
jgi:4a-hydroxytetrahydrobiopterin dehydratase